MLRRLVYVTHKIGLALRLPNELLTVTRRIANYSSASASRLEGDVEQFAAANVRF